MHISYFPREQAVEKLGVDPGDSTNTFLSGTRSWEFRTHTWSWDKSREPFLGPEFPTGMPTSKLSCFFLELGQSHCGLSCEDQVGILSLWKTGVPSCSL